MKIQQEPIEFKPIIISLESPSEVNLFLDMLDDISERSFKYTNSSHSEYRSFVNNLDNKIMELYKGDRSEG